MSVADVVAWADGLIGQDRANDVPQLLDLSLIRSDRIGEAVSLLGEVPGEWAPSDVGRSIARLVRARLVSGELTERRAATVLFRVVIEGLSPDAEFEGMAYSFDHLLDHALQGHVATLAEVRVQMIEYLATI